MMQGVAFNAMSPSIGLKTNIHHPLMMTNINNNFKPTMVIKAARQTMLENNMDKAVVIGKTRGFHELYKLRGEVLINAKSGRKINSDHFRKDDESTHHSVVKILIGEKREDSQKTLSPIHFDLYEKIIFVHDEKEKLVVNGVPRARPKQEKKSKLGRLFSRSSSRKISSDGEEPEQVKIA